MNELETKEWIELMTHIRDVVRGDKPFEHPGGPAFHPGQKYEVTDVDKEFDRQTRNTMARNAIGTGLLWGLTPMVLFNIPNVRNSFLFRNSKSPNLAVMVMGSMGYIRGSLAGADAFAERRFKLDSPIGR